MIGRQYGFQCPHCKSKLITVMTRQLTPLLQERYTRCQNEKCQATYKVYVELTEQVYKPLDQLPLFDD